MPMPRGFPRPRKFVKKITPKAGNRGDYSNWDNKSYPIPYSAKLTDIGDIAKRRVDECRKDRLCMVCGIEVVDELPWAYYLNFSLERDAGPFHEKCKTLTQKMCPVVHVNPDFTFVQMPWEILESRSFSRLSYYLKTGTDKGAPKS